MARPSLHSDQELLEVARSTFLELGPGVSTQVIAERAGVSQATLFKRFGSKDTLLVRALRPPECPPFAALLDEGPDKRPFAAQLREVLGEMDRFFVEMAPAIGLLRSLGRDHAEDLLDYDEPPPLRAHRSLSAWLARATERGLLREIDHDAAALMLMGSFHSRHFLGFVLGLKELGGERERFIQALTDILLSPGETP